MTISASTVAAAPEGTLPAGPVIRPPRRASRRRMILLAAFLLPSLALFTTFVIYPVVRAMQMSLYDWDGFGPLVDFIGLSNFQFALADPGFQGALGHTAFFMAASVLFQLPLALALALLVRRGIPGGRAFRLILFLPYVFSDVVAAQIWNFLYQPGFGAVNAIIGVVGIPPQDWLGNERLAMPAIFVVMTWKWVGFWMTLYITGLSQIPEEIEEAARLDGVNAWQMIRHITLPMLAPTIRLTAYLAVLGSLQTFELVFVMTQGGPAGATETIATYMYNFGFRSYQLGYGSAVAVILFIICFMFSVLYQKYVFRRDLVLEGS